MDRFFFLLHYGKKFIQGLPQCHPHRSEKIRVSKSIQELIEPGGRFLNQSKATPLRVPINNLVMMASLSITLPVWDQK